MYPSAYTGSMTFLLVIMFMTGCTSSPEPETAVVVEDNPLLATLYEQDQADRSGGFDGIDWSVVNVRDSLRRAQVDSLLALGEVRTASDYHHAAMVFQHGSDTTAARKAYELANKAVEQDSTHEKAPWLMAAAWDRYKMRLGEPQWYGTQFVKDNPDSPWRLYDVDTTAVTDADRARLGVPPLDSARARVKGLNAQ